MSGYLIETKAQSATLGDCDRLLAALRGDYIPSLRIELNFESTEDVRPCMVLRLVDEVAGDEPPAFVRSVWSQRRFYNDLHLITCGALFDLLITGYRAIDVFFTTGEDNRPRPVKG